MPFLQVGKANHKTRKDALTMGYGCLLFDLDGTLIDSRADLANSVNLMLAELGRGPLPRERVLGFVGEGVRLLVERALRAGFGREVRDAEIERALGIYLRHYGEHLLDETKLYPGVAETLAALTHIPKAVVTNKPYQFTATILERLGVLSHFAAVLGGDSLPERKPAPQPLVEAARRCGRDPAECLMVGDSRVDVVAGHAAGMKTCGFVAGFRGRDELVEAGADLLIERFSELQEVISDGR
ncbi:MAG TPA: phosphoglycolate phosphatase [Blastocatellia bacterium]|nr:phosphoglycolate phosphatase [Blastocatellia bacterium]